MPLPALPLPLPDIADTVARWPALGLKPCAGMLYHNRQGQGYACVVGVLAYPGSYDTFIAQYGSSALDGLMAGFDSNFHIVNGPAAPASPTSPDYVAAFTYGRSVALELGSQETWNVR